MARTEKHVDARSCHACGGEFAHNFTILAIHDGGGCGALTRVDLTRLAAVVAWSLDHKKAQERQQAQQAVERRRAELRVIRQS